MRWLGLLLFAFLLLSPVYAQEAASPTLILIEGENTDQPHPRSVYEAGLDGSLEFLMELEAAQTIFCIAGTRLCISDPELADNQMLYFDIRQRQFMAAHLDVMISPLPTPTLDMPYNPLYGPEILEIYWGERQLILMAGEQDNFVNVFMLQNGELEQITDVVALFPDAVQPVLSASVNVISLNPEQTGVLYRARLRDAAGTDHNALYFYDGETGATIEMPYFGTDPVWSPDGTMLAGSRLAQLADGRPIYELWTVNLETGEEMLIAQGCNPQWSPDGTRLAYEAHTNAQWSGYTDCYANGEIAAYEFSSGETVVLTETLDGFVQLVGWIE